MRTAHGFFFAEDTYLVDKKGLVKYLAEKINVGLMCIQCETQEKKSAEAVKQHMMDKGHCFMSTDSFEEYMDYYDYTLVIEKNPTQENTENSSKDFLIQSDTKVIQDSDDSEWELVDEDENEEQPKGKKKERKPSAQSNKDELTRD